MLPRLGIVAVAMSMAIAQPSLQQRERATGPEAAAVIEVGANVQVSIGNARRHHQEVDLAADPRLPGGLLACSMILPPAPTNQAVRTIAYYSSDGGRSWQPTLEVETGISNNHDPTCEFGPDGTAYFAAVETNFGAVGDNRTLPPEQTDRDYVLLYRSETGGRTWSKPQVLQGYDRPWLVVDSTAGPRRGVVYMTSHDYESRVDGGRTSTLRTHALAADGAPLVGTTVVTSAPRVSNGVVLSDGSYVIVVAEEAQGRSSEPTRPAPYSRSLPSSHVLKAIRSVDGGRSFSAAAAIGNAYEVVLPYALMGLSLTADASDGAFRDRLYLAWSDARSGRYNILLAFSDDKGRTWSDPVIVNDDGPPAAGRLGPDHYMAVVRVNRAGVVGVSWYDRRDSPDNIGYHVRFAASLDGGETFLPSVRVSAGAQSTSHPTWTIRAGAMGGGDVIPRYRTTPFLRLIGASSVNFAGHTAGLAPMPDGRFQALWVDNRTEVAQVWTAGVTVRASVRRHGSPDLDALTDVSKQVTAYLADSEFHPVDGTAFTTAYIVNTSDVPLEVPLKLRAVALRSDFGRLLAANADNAMTGPGAIWDFSDRVADGRLRPGERTRGYELRFRIEDVRRLDGATIDYHSSLKVFDIGARVFARVQKPGVSHGGQH